MVECPSVCPVDRQQQRRAAGFLQLGRGQQKSIDINWRRRVSAIDRYLPPTRRFAAAGRVNLGPIVRRSNLTCELAVAVTVDSHEFGQQKSWDVWRNMKVSSVDCFIHTRQRSSIIMYPSHVGPYCVSAGRLISKGQFTAHELN